MLVFLSREGVVFLVLCRLPISLWFTSYLLLCPKLTDAPYSVYGAPPLFLFKMASSFTGSAHSPFPGRNTLRTDGTHNGPNPEWTQPQMDSTPTGLNPADSTLNGLNPDWDSTPNGLNSEWDSTSNLYQPRMVQFQGVYQENVFKKRIQ
jgi:hypothetical protein